MCRFAHSGRVLERPERLVVDVRLDVGRGARVLAGLASRPGVASVIAGATRPEQVRANAAAGEWRLSAEELAAL